MSKTYDPIPEYMEKVAKEVVDSAFHVHQELGPGLLEQIYEACMNYELGTRKLHVESQVIYPVFYKEIQMDTGLRIDLLVEDCIVVELKSVEKLNPLYEAQLLTYLKLANKRLGFLINFNVPLIRDGIKRLVR